tara:strand:- start:223 stop:1347 length:1125 start_codon:yes stop_codon:yes gene_type:complete
MSLKSSKYPFFKNLKPSLKKISKYVPGESEDKNNNRIIKLSSNESPFTLSKKILLNISTKLKNCNRYPDGDCRIIKNALVKKFNLNSKQIICGNGSDDILALICNAFSRENTEVICSNYGFIYYPVVAYASGAKVVNAKTKNLSISTSNILKKITKNTKIIFIANPNNPTGSIIFKDELIKFLKKVPKKIIIVLDGAYAEYIDDKRFSDGLDLVRKYPNIVITRTFSKIFGIAGLRLGWAYSSKEVIELMEKIRGPFNVNTIAQVAASEILSDESFLEKSIKHNDKTKQWLSTELKNLGLNVIESYTNFLLVKTNKNQMSAKDIVERLKEKGILVRGLENYKLPNFFRVSLGKKEELKVFIDYLSKILKGGKKY